MREGLVSLVLSKDGAQRLLEWELVSERTIRAMSTQGGSRGAHGQIVPCLYKRGNKGGKVRLL